jgi:hypothetical protein
MKKPGTASPRPVFIMSSFSSLLFSSGVGGRITAISVALTRIGLGLARPARLCLGLGGAALFTLTPVFRNPWGVSVSVRSGFLPGLSRRALGRRPTFGRLDQRAVTSIVISLYDIRLRRVSSIASARFISASIASASITSAFIALRTIAIALGLALAVFALLLLTLGVLIALGVQFLLRFAQKTQVVLCVLLEIFCRNPVVGQLRITCQLVVFFNNLLRRAAHFALGARTVEHTIDDIADRVGAVSVRLIART